MLKTLPLLLAVWLLQLIVTEGAPASRQDCGQLRISSRIVGGQDVPNGDLPWVASIVVDFRPVCGGSLINEQWVLTAASCVDQISSIQQYNVLLGAHQLLNLSHNVQFYPVQKILIHSGYLGEAGSPADIALLKLASPVPFTSHILPVCLPQFYEDFSRDTNCWIAGWGNTGENEQLSAPLTLQEAKVPIIGRRECNNFYNAVPFRGMKKDPIKPDMICTGYTQGSKSFCMGDGGGPLVCKVGRRWTQAGIVSWGVGCGKYFHPGVYTSVPFYSFWIKEKIRTE
ncbi:serine protease 27-like [Candoia aspera]|uniref:serine protease 27-like n=1 Tax=Candoia aspera TaxID=51853 RepID=UPI002FD837E4